MSDRPSQTFRTDRSARSSGIAIVLAAIVLGGSGVFGLMAVGEGLAQRGGDGVTVTGSARMEVDADRAVWTIQAFEQAEDIATAVERTERSVAAVTEYLVLGGIDDDSSGQWHGGVCLPGPAGRRCSKEAASV